jgi:hypothetical protein
MWLWEFLNGATGPVAPGEVEVKDPIILCPACRQPAGRIRRQRGWRCRTTGCPDIGREVAEDGEVMVLKSALVAEEEQALLAWALSCQKDDTPKRAPVL